MLKPTFSRVLTALLYALPTLFFVVCYFLIVTSGEDIFQGANTPPSIIQDALAAFHHSARLADMYAWSVINFFDYTFSFGIDTLFRLLDVAVAFSIFYLNTALALGRRPRFRLGDAATFAALFLLVFLTPHGFILYAGFSAIHNYLFICFFSTLYLGLLARALLGRPFLIKHPLLASVSMLLLGFLFGFASNTTALIFLLALALFLLIQKILKHPQPLPAWFLSSLGGIVLALILIYVVGSGLSDYTSSSYYLQSYDYLSFSDILTNPLAAIPKILTHLIANFGRFFFPLLAVAIPAFFYVRLKTSRPVKSLLKSLNFTARERTFLTASAIFIFIYVLAFSQLRCPTRLFLPAYFLAIAVLLFVLRRFFATLKASKTQKSLLSTLLLLPLLALLIGRTVLAVEYLSRALPLFHQIQNSPEDTLCLNPAEFSPRLLPFIYLGQDAFMVEWATPELIYNKSVTICPEP